MLQYLHISKIICNFAPSYMKIPEQILHAAQELTTRYGNQLMYRGCYNDCSVYQFCFPKDLDTGFPILYLFNGNEVTTLQGSETCDIIKQLRHA